jgi:hypothetical protein
MQMKMRKFGHDASPVTTRAIDDQPTSNNQTRQRSDRVRVRRKLSSLILKTIAGGDAPVVTMVHQLTSD